MSAWTLAWIDTDVWRKRADEDPTAMEQVGATLRHWSAGGEATQEFTGFGLPQSEGMTMSFVEGQETKLVVWGPGDLAFYPASSPDEVTAFLANKNDGNDGSVLIVAVDYDEARRRSGFEVGEAVLALLDGHEKADLGHTMAAGTGWHSSHRLRDVLGCRPFSKGRHPSSSPVGTSGRWLMRWQGPARKPKSRGAAAPSSPPPERRPP